MLQLRAPFLALILCAALAARAGAAEKVALKITDLVMGEGPAVEVGALVTTHYTGWLETGAKFDSSLDRDKPLTFRVGVGQVIRGWDLGLRGMRSGGKRELVVSPELAYGARGAGGVIPPNATLRFEIDLVDLTPPDFSNLDNAGLAAMLRRGVPVIDIRRPEEWRKTGVVAGSHLITFFDEKGRINPNFPERLRAIAAPDDEVILICRTGNRTAALADMLSRKAGHGRIHNVTDGITLWIADGGPVTAPSMPETCWLCDQGG